MIKFKYRAIDANKKKFSGIYLAENETILQEKLLEQGLYLLSCKQIKSSTPNAFFTLNGKVTLKDLSAFCRQFALLLSSSLEIINCLELLKAQQSNGFFTKILDNVYEDVRAGMSLAKAFEKHKKVFPNFFTSMLYVGEMSSSLDKVLLSLADYMESDLKLKSKVKSAMIYPIVLIVLMIAVLVLMMAFIIPTFRDSMSRIDIELPQITQAIYSASDFFAQNWTYVFLGIVAFVLLFKGIISIKKGRYVWDLLKLKIPFIKKITINLISARLARGLGLLVNSGMKLVDAMHVARKLLSNTYVEKKFDIAIDRVKSGVPLNKALEEMNVFENVFVHMVAVAEGTATLDTGLMSAGVYYDERSATLLGGITNILQPMIMLLLGVVVAVLFLAVYSPITAMMEGLAP